MAATVLLSQHSSNPCEVSSSDSRNKAYHREYMKALQMRGDAISSDDRIQGMLLADVHHAPSPRPTAGPSAPLRRSQNGAQRWTVDLDEDMDSEIESDAEMVQDDEEGQDADAQGETDEEMSIYLKPQDKREEIGEEMADLEEAVPRLKEDYKLVDRLGTGTFSSVYKAVDLRYHDKWDNTPWHGRHPPSSSAYYQSAPRPRETKVFVAVKRIYVTSAPERIRNEIAIMEDCRGCRHVSQLITAFRHEDQIVAIMPYHRNQDFREYFRIVPMEGMKAYFRCMFRALRDVNSRGIIHRDVKPANFLYDPRTGIGTLCDFGLACRMESGPAHGVCLHTSPTREYPHGRLRHRGEYDVTQLKKMQKEARMKSNWPSEKVGYPEKDTRPISKANRAGTRGFRAPEVLLKCGEQTGAVDMWSVGMILLFFLIGKFPLFQSNDDIEALMEIAAIIGRRRMEKVAALHSRTFSTNVPSITVDGITWREFVEKQNPDLMKPPAPDMRLYPYNCTRTPTSIDSHILPSSSSSATAVPSGSLSSSPHLFTPPTQEEYAADIDKAFDLLERLLQPESTHRITPRGALYHEFLASPDEGDDDEFFPHPFGEGVCGEWHFYDDVTEEPCVNITCEDGSTVVRRLSSGEGIAIGTHPCEFHQTEFDYS